MTHLLNGARFLHVEKHFERESHRSRWRGSKFSFKADGEKDYSTKLA